MKFFLSVVLVLCLTTNSFGFFYELERVLKDKIVEKTVETIDNVLSPQQKSNQNNQNQQQQQLIQQPSQQQNLNQRSIQNLSMYDELVKLIEQRNIDVGITTYEKMFGVKPRIDIVNYLTKSSKLQGYYNQLYYNIFYLDDNVVYYVFPKYYIFFSLDGGKNYGLLFSFENVSKYLKENYPFLTNAHTHNSRIVFSKKPGVIYLYTTYWIVRTDDYGKTWNVVYHTTFGENEIKNILYHYDGKNDLLYMIHYDPKVVAHKMSIINGFNGKILKTMNSKDGSLDNVILLNTSTLFRGYNFCYGSNDRFCNIFYKIVGNELVRHEKFVITRNEHDNKFGVGGNKHFQVDNNLFIFKGNNGYIGFNDIAKNLIIKTDYSAFDMHVNGKLVTLDGNKISIDGGKTFETIRGFKCFATNGYVSNILCFQEEPGMYYKFNIKTKQIESISYLNKVPIFFMFDSLSFDNLRTNIYKEEFNNILRRYDLMFDKNGVYRPTSGGIQSDYVLRDKTLYRIVKVDTDQYVVFGTGVIYVNTDRTFSNWRKYSVSEHFKFDDALKIGNTLLLMDNKIIYELII